MSLVKELPIDIIKNKKLTRLMGKSKTVYVDKKRQAEALIYSRNYKKFKGLLQEHSQLNLTLLKSEKKVKKGR
ncbi:unnamed protein product [marine sediment metagenome]|uniref:Uncharacterized protein n=1 Tax=marine sediment metagenome TaxID=412755 RepID=X1CTI8_9ZZZZ